jgi:hypothetical protein
MNRFLQFVIVAGLATMTVMAAPSIPFQGTAQWSSLSGVPSNLTFTPVPFAGDLNALSGDGDVEYGTFTLNHSSCFSNCSVNGTFDLTLTFTLPGGNSGPVTADLDVTGSVFFLLNSVTISFDSFDTPYTVTYDNGSYHGSFNVAFDSDDDVTVTGSDPPAYFDISNVTYAQDVASNPEPAVTLLFGTMLAGVAFASKRRFLGKVSR